MDILNDIVVQIELHSTGSIRACFEKGVNPNAIFRNQPLIYELTSEYTRSPRFKDCVKAFVDYGLVFHDKALLAVLMDDAAMLEECLSTDPEQINRIYNLQCAYTALEEVSLIHICAEFNHVSCAEVLVRYGADINATAGVDEYGFGGQSPVFHTVNQNGNQSVEMLRFLLANKADLNITLKGLIWGKGYEWETLIPAVNPISYAMMGLLPQMHRDETVIAGTVSMLLEYAYGLQYTPKNVPCAYLKK